MSWALLLFAVAGPGPVCLAESTEIAPLIRAVTATAPQVSHNAVSTAIRAVACVEKGEPKSRYLGVIDYSLPSTAKRFWLVDLKRREVLRQELVAHGRGSGEDLATSFSNDDGSLQSSLGLFLTGDTYMGQHGYSLRLHGIEPGFNDRAFDRKIVLHGADYVGSKFIDQWHRLGRSWGCPVFAPEAVKGIIDVLKDGSYLFAYYPDKEYFSGSPVLNSCGDKS